MQNIVIFIILFLLRIVKIYLSIGIIIAAILTFLGSLLYLIDANEFNSAMKEINNEFKHKGEEFKSYISMCLFMLITLILLWPWCIRAAFKKK